MNSRIFLAVILTFLPVVPIGAERDTRVGTKPPKPFTLEQVWALDAIYSDQRHGVSFRYPSVWRPMTQFGYHPPALTQANVGSALAGFGYVEGGFPRDHIVGAYTATNLEGLGIVYAAASSANAGACESTASTIAGTAAHVGVLLGGRYFSRRETGEAGMSQSNAGKLYSIYIHPTCYLFETDVAVTSAASDGFKTLNPQQTGFIQKHLLLIMKSLRIVPP